ncbi:MAG: PAS domain S-box protein [Syntrophobacterales bacterium]|jgi:PAS domain S-box-containing protein|nr:PAS domain S-box protein [Syntrophobacterales bacterium]
MKAEQNLEYVSEWQDFLLSFQGELSGMSDAELLRCVLEKLVRLTNSQAGFISVLNENGQTDMITWSKKTLENCANIFQGHHDLEHRSIWQECIGQKKAVICNRYGHSEKKKDFPRGHLSIRRYIAAPGIEQGEISLIVVLANKSRDYTNQNLLFVQMAINNLQITRKYIHTKDRLSSAIQGSFDGLWGWNLSKKDFFASPSFFTILGYEPNEFSPTPEVFWSLVHPDDVGRLKMMVNNTLEHAWHADQEAIEFRVKTQTGEWRWIRSRWKIIERGEDNRPLRLVGTSADISKQKQTEEALRESEERYRILVEKTNDPIALLNTKLEFVDCNPKFMELTQWNLSELIAHPVWEHSPILQLHGKDAQETIKEHALKALAGQSQKFTWWLSRKDGHDMEMLAFLDTLTLGGKQYLQIIGRDVSVIEKSGTPASFQGSDWKRLIEQSAVGIYLVQDGLFRYVNEKFAHAAGYSSLDLTGGMGLSDLILTDNVPLLTSFCQQEIEEKKVHRFYCRLRAKNGGIRYVELRGFEMIHQGKQTLMGTIWDTEEQLQSVQTPAEETREHKELMRYLSDIVDFLPHAILVVDQEGKIIFWNRAMALLSGVDKEAMLGKGDYEYALPFYGKRTPMLIDFALHPDMGKMEHLSHIQEMGNVYVNKLKAKNLPAGEAHLFITASVLKNHRQEIIGAIQCIQDITERKLLESQLRQAQKMEAIGALVGGIAHDFNNILSALTGYTELAMMSKENADLVDNYLTQVLKACDRAKGLVSQILVFSRQREHEKSMVDMRVAVKEVLKLLSASLPSTIEIRQHIAPEPLTIMADPTQIHQIIMNLCTNAAHAMAKKGGALTIHLSKTTIGEEETDHSDQKPGTYAHLVISDTGHGIDPDIIDKIFEPFFTTKRRGKGTGLGLWVVHGIVQRYNGSIQVKSEPGQGTSFYIALPFVAERRTAGDRETEDILQGGNETILLVDDEKNLLKVMEDFLKGLGYRVVSQANSRKALDMVTASPQRFDLVIADMTMPNLTGLELSRSILAVNPDMFIILCTGFSEAVTENSAKKIGIKEFIFKPIPLRQLARSVRRVLDGK